MLSRTLLFSLKWMCFRLATGVFVAFVGCVVIGFAILFIGLVNSYCGLLGAG